MKAFIHTDWWDVLKPEFEKPYYHQLHEFLKNEYRTKNIHPDMYNIFRPLNGRRFQIQRSLS